MRNKKTMPGRGTGRVEPHLMEPSAKGDPWSFLALRRGIKAEDCCVGLRWGLDEGAQIKGPVDTQPVESKPVSVV